MVFISNLFNTHPRFNWAIPMDETIKVTKDQKDILKIIVAGFINKKVYQGHNTTREEMELEREDQKKMRELYKQL